MSSTQIETTVKLVGWIRSTAEAIQHHDLSSTEVRAALLDLGTDPNFRRITNEINRMAQDQK